MIWLRHDLRRLIGYLSRLRRCGCIGISAAVLVYLLGNCDRATHKPSPSRGSQSMCDRMEAWFAPLQLGMPKNAVDSIGAHVEPQMTTLTPSQIIEGGWLTLEGNRRVYFGLDKKGNVCFLKTFDSRPRFGDGDVGVGSSLGDAKKLVGAVEANYTGLGKFVRICPHIWLAHYCNRPEEIGDKATCHAIEVRTE